MDTKQRTLALLVGGLTDRAVAHRLGVSERTVQRYVRALMDGAHCRNRMQLGRFAALTGLSGLSGLPGLPELPGSSEPPQAPGAPAPEPVPPPGGREPDREGRQLLRLLLDDAGEEALRSLHLSRRSVERRIKDLMTLAGARSRVQLGWLATVWGWI
jgi:DNA-binding CsgD family transcriptional regulator